MCNSKLHDSLCVNVAQHCQYSVLMIRRQAKWPVIGVNDDNNDEL